MGFMSIGRGIVNILAPLSNVTKSQNTEIGKNKRSTMASGDSTGEVNNEDNMDEKGYDEFIKRLQQNSHVDISEMLSQQMLMTSLSGNNYDNNDRKRMINNEHVVEEDVDFNHSVVNVSKQIEMLLGPRKRWCTESDEVSMFREEMNKLREETKHQSNNPLLPPVYLSNEPLPSNFENKSIVCKIHLISKNISKAIKCNPLTTADAFAESFIKTINAQYSEEKKPGEWFFKASGSNEYMYGDIPLIQFVAIRKCIKNGSIVKLNLISKEEVLNSMDPQDTTVKKISYNIYSEDSYIPNADAKKLWHLNEPFNVNITSISLPVIPKELSKEPSSFNVYIVAQMYHGGIALTKPRYTKLVPLSKYVLWNEKLFLSDIFFSEIPREARLCFTCYARPLDKKSSSQPSGEKITVGPKDIPIGYINDRLFNHKALLLTGSKKFKIWADQASSPLSTCLENIGSEISPILEVMFEPNGISVSFPSSTEKPSIYFDNRLKMFQAQFLSLYNKQYSDVELDKKLNRIISIDPLSDLTEEERYLIWKNRQKITQYPNALPKFIESVPWNCPSAVYIAKQLLLEWAPMEPVNALQLLSYKFADTSVRKYALKLLDSLKDHELTDLLLQLVQTLKYELNHDSPLVRFLLERSLSCSNIIGHIMYWHLKSEMHMPSIRERHGLILEEYLANCGSHRIDLINQSAVVNQLIDIALEIKKTKKTEQLSVLRELLSEIKLPPKFKLPLSPRIEVRGIVVEKCKVMDSKKLPLWLVFENNDPTGEPLYVIFKSGDDLRQDILTLQVLKVMDTLWKKENLDLYMQPYDCVAIGDMIGMIEIVLNSDTVANITNARGGASAAFSQDPLAIWLAMHNETESAWDACVNNFARSCAGYCCATYVLGIGDRHNDNIMLTKKGGLFHIDFGHFLGNYKSKLGIKRETTPFVFTPMYAYVMGGAPDGDNFKLFTQLSCKAFNIIRRHSHLLMNLFILMMATGIPELKTIEDVLWLRNCLVLEKTEEEANHYFNKLISKSLKNTRAKIGDAVHILVHK